jgi:GrpB-like predicted nucleotidyltransferase (UPF0157 family)
MASQIPVVVTYRPDWTAQAADLVATLREELGEVAARIEHIGSTAIPAHGRFKASPAEIAEDTDVYADIKDPVVDLVIVVVESWAALSGWQP